jgi:DNA-binding NarL/FixJ family response regulator
MPRKRVVVFEDLTVVRDLLVEALAADYEIAGAFEEGARGVKEAIRLAPDVALVDYMLPGLNGLDVARKLLAALPRVRVILITAHDRPEVLLEAVDAGVHGVVTKGTPLRTLKDAVAQVLTTGAYYCPATSAALRDARSAPRKKDPLTAREREIVQLIASGLTNKDVAKRLGLSEKTVSNHRTNLMKKLGVHDVATLTRYAVERGLVVLR